MFETWQQFEEHVRELFDSAEYETKFRVVFETPGMEQSRSEIDVVAEDHRYVLCMDCKLYGASRRRRSALKQEARKHEKRVVEYQRGREKRCVPLLVTIWDDLLRENGCFIIPLKKLNDFVLNIERYLDELTLN